RLEPQLVILGLQPLGFREGEKGRDHTGQYARYHRGASEQPLDRFVVTEEIRRASKQSADGHRHPEQGFSALFTVKRAIAVWPICDSLVRTSSGIFLYH